MHESSIAKRILSEVLRRAGTDGDSARPARIIAVRGRVAETERLSKESLSFHFAAHALGTIAEGARLELDVSPAHVRCSACGETYVPEHHVRLCPQCGGTEGELTGQEGLWIESVDVR